MTSTEILSFTLQSEGHWTAIRSRISTVNECISRCGHYWTKKSVWAEEGIASITAKWTNYPVWFTFADVSFVIKNVLSFNIQWTLTASAVAVGRRLSLLFSVWSSEIFCSCFSPASDANSKLLLTLCLPARLPYAPKQTKHHWLYSRDKGGWSEDAIWWTSRLTIRRLPRIFLFRNGDQKKTRDNVLSANFFTFHE